MWAWASVNVGNESDYVCGTDIDGFIDYCRTHTSVTSFHNLCFDGVFIMDYMLRHSIRWVKKNPQEDEFTTLIDRRGKVYSITINLGGVITEFRDSYKKLPMRVADLAQAFHQPECKGEIDYNARRPAGYEPTVEEWDYLRRDVVIVARALRETLAEGMTRLTVGSDSMAEYKSLVGGERYFRKAFPLLSSDTDEEIRAAYKGGFTYADRRRAGVMVGEGSVYDVNSLYPYVMHVRPLPYGQPHAFSAAPPDGVLWTAVVTFCASLKSDHVPCMQIKRNIIFSGTEYLTEVPEPVTTTVTSVDWALWNDFYDISDVEWEGGFWFDSRTGMVSDYIDKWMDVKSTSTGGRRTIAKLFLNSLYGKFAKSTNVTGKHPVLDGDHVNLALNEYESCDPVYTPLSVFVTAWARDYTVRTAQRNYDRFLYADTDSLHVLGREPLVDVEVHPTKLGAWKHEADFTEAVFVRAKQYSEMIDGRPVTHIAGLPRDVAMKVFPADLLHNNLWHGKLVPRRVRGGVVLTETTFNFKRVENKDGQEG